MDLFDNIYPKINLQNNSSIPSANISSTEEVDENSIMTSSNGDTDATNILELDDNWTEIKPKDKKVLGLFKSDKTVYTSDNGISIEFDGSCEQVCIKENKETGEIIIIGAENAKITGSEDGANISIYDSKIDSINLKSENDELYINNSKIGEIKSKKGHDSITLVNNSTAKSIDTGKGNDNVFIEDSLVDYINLNKNDDYVHLDNSYVGEVKDKNGTSQVVLKDSDINTLSISELQNAVVLDDSNICNLYSKSENNIIDLEDSVIENNIRNKKDVAPITEEDSINKMEEIPQLDELTEDLAIKIFENKAQKYSDKILTPEQQLQALTISSFETNLKNMRDNFEEQKNSDGVINNSYNAIKELMDFGVSAVDIENAIKEQEDMISELKAALNGDIDSSFEEVFKKWTNIDYDEEAIIRNQEVSQTYSLALTGISKSNAFQNYIFSADSLDEVYNGFIQYYGNEELARQELNTYLNETMLSEENKMHFGFIEEIYINENNQLVVKRPAETDAFGGIEGTEIITTTENLSNVNNMIKNFSICFDKDKFTNSFVEKYEKTMGIKLEDIQKEVVTTQLKAYGKNNSFQKLIDKYMEEQEGFADKISTTMQLSGLGLTVIGGVATLVYPPAINLMFFGQKLAFTGMWTNNALEAFDEFTSESKINQEEFNTLLKDFAIDFALYYSGKKINIVSSAVNKDVLDLTNQKFLAVLSEVASDASLSLMADFIITGDVDLTGEGINQALTILTGLAGSKAKIYRENRIKNENIHIENSRNRLSEEIRTEVNSGETIRFSQYSNILLDEVWKLEVKKVSPTTISKHIQETIKSEFLKDNIRIDEAMRLFLYINKKTSGIYHINKLSDFGDFRRSILGTEDIDYSKEIEFIRSLDYKDKDIKQAFEDFALTPDEALLYCAYIRDGKFPAQEALTYVYLNKGEKNYNQKIEYLKNGMSLAEMKSFSSKNIPVDQITEYRRIKETDFTNENLLLSALKSGYKNEDLDTICDIARKLPEYTQVSDVETILAANLSTEQLNRVIEILSNKDLEISESDNAILFCRYGFTDENIRFLYDEGKRHKLDVPQVRTYFKALEYDLSKGEALLIAHGRYSDEEIEKMAPVVKAMEAYPRNFTEAVINNKIYDYENFMQYYREIDWEQIYELAPEVKKYYSSDKIDMAAFHYMAGTTEFNKESLSMDDKLTTYLMQNYLSANALTKYLKYLPLSSRYVGEIPEGIIDSSLSNTDAVTQKVYDEIDQFIKDKNVTELQNSLAETLGKDVKIKYCGEGTFGVAYKVEVEGCGPLCLKVFNNLALSTYSYSMHGGHIEPQTALFANNYSNDFVKMYFGRVAGLNSEDGFMVTQFLDKNTIPEDTKYDKDSTLYISSNDLHDNNYVGSKIIDFGGMIVQDGDSIIHEWRIN